jgi:hypothetical protein
MHENNSIVSEMPSWKVHRALYEKLSREVEDFFVETPGLLDRIDRIIDREYGEHDLGRSADPWSLSRMLRALWLEFGDVYDMATKRFLYTDYFERRKIEREIQRKPELFQRYMLYIPDDVLVLATLHHILDIATYCLLNVYPPITADESPLLFEMTEKFMRNYTEQLKELETTELKTIGSTFERVFGRLIGILKERAREVYVMLVEYLKSKGLEPGYGPEVLKSLLVEFVRKKEYYGIIYVNNTPLPVAAAAVRAFNELVKGEEVVLGFSRWRGPYPPVHEEVRALSVRELCEKLRIELQK